jgi:environmental stress-induced protein Ves
MFKILPEEAYRRTAWKNGRGVTEDVLMLPEGASHDDFDVRISRASIVDPAPFSAFPGIDRAITRLGENPLVLCFADGSEVALEHLAPYRFDSALMPTSRLPAGHTQVLNVMTRRGRWRNVVTAIRGNARQTLEGAGRGFGVVYAMGAGCTVAGHHVGPGQTLIMQPGVHAEMEVLSGGACLIAVIEPED